MFITSSWHFHHRPHSWSSSLSWHDIVSWCCKMHHMQCKAAKSNGNTYQVLAPFQIVPWHYARWPVSTEERWMVVLAKESNIHVDETRQSRSVLFRLYDCTDAKQDVYSIKTWACLAPPSCRSDFATFLTPPNSLVWLEWNFLKRTLSTLFSSFLRATTSSVRGFVVKYNLWWIVTNVYLDFLFNGSLNMWLISFILHGKHFLFEQRFNDRRS